MILCLKLEIPIPEKCKPYHLKLRWVNQVQQDKEVIAQGLLKLRDLGSQTLNQRILFKGVGGVVGIYQES